MSDPTDGSFETEAGLENGSGALDGLEGGADNVREIGSSRPFRNAALQYLQAGWFPFPLQPKQKEPWASGVTGRKNHFPENPEKQISDWIAEAPAQANIGLWLTEEVIGIDVDAYDGKKGGDTLRVLEQKYGKLPATWLSSARADGISGIRFFRVPKRWVGKLSWSGKAGAGIDIIQRGHRYAAVWPSWNPLANDGQGAVYQWYRPGAKPNGHPDRWFNARSVPVDGAGINGSSSGIGIRVLFELEDVKALPQVAELAELPEKWVEFLTRGYVEKTEQAIDMESSGQEIEKWARERFPSAKKVLIESGPKAGKYQFKTCRQLERRLEGAKEKVMGDPASHPELVAAHWSILKCGVEGHSGALLTAKRFEDFWIKYVVKEIQKRGLREADQERFRSRIEALRKIKGEADERLAAGGNPFKTICACPGVTGGWDVPSETVESLMKSLSGGVASDGNGPGNGGPDGNLGKAGDPDSYRLNDDGNADHLVDIFGENLAWVPGLKIWIFWTGKRWVHDDDGLARRCWRVVRNRQEAFAKSLLAKMSEALEAAGGDTQDPEYKKAKVRALEWRDFSKKSGTNHGAENALKAAQANEGVSIQAEKLDVNHRLLGVENGVVELLDSGINFRQARRDDLVTLNTGVAYLDGQGLEKAGADVGRGRVLWQNYLDLFIPDMELRRFVQKVMSYCLFGGNPERLGIFLVGGTSTGKSTLLNAMMAALGQYAAVVDLSLFKAKKDSGGPSPELIRVLPKRVITATEAGMDHFNAEVFKRLTGNDPMTARQMHSGVMIERKPAFTPIIATNAAPTIRGADAALRKRLLIIPFREQVSKEQDSKLAGQDLETLAREAVLHWLVEGWKMYVQEGLDPATWPVKVADEVDEFIADLSYELAFIRDCVVKLKPEKGKTKGEQSVPVREVYDEFQQWCLHNGADPARKLEFTAWTKVMKANGFIAETIAVPGSGQVKAKQYPYISLKKVQGINFKFKGAQ